MSTLELHNNLEKCIELRDEEKLDRMLKKITNFFPERIEKELINEAYQKLASWRLEKALDELSKKPKLFVLDISNFRNAVNAAQLSEHASNIRKDVLKRAVSRLREEEAYQVKDKHNTIIIITNISISKNKGKMDN